ncbi:MAG: serine/threonine protein kinase [Polyangiaceae bacterium]|nr:serine/threonine protein kinase [Polyangiaceae bacterium]
MPAAKLLDVGPEGKQRLDRYELVAEIASGGMATVFLARLSGMGGFQRFVAIKRLHPHLAGEQEFVDMFLDEARLAAQIHHPNVVPILEVGASDRGYYIVMEYIEGDTLARLLARAATVGGRVPASIGVRVLVDTLAGLHAAHELHDHEGRLVELVHRDVSPQNVLVGVDGLTRITDFGVARAESRLSATRVGQLKGKIAYMAPEQAAGSPDVDRRADVFSAGIVLWEVLAGRRLFKAENEAATLSRVVSEPIPRLTQIVPEISLRLSAVAMKALDRDIEKRFQSCREFADALEEAATASKTISSQRDVAAYVTEVLGQEISQARDAVRAWLARSEPSQVAVPEVAGAHGYASAPPSSTVSAAGVTVASPRPAAPEGDASPPQRSRKGLAIGLGAAAALGLVLAVLAAGGGAGAPPVAATPPPPQPAPVEPAVAAAPAPSPAITASAAAVEQPPASGTPAAPEEKAATPTHRGARGAAPARPAAEKPAAPAKPAVKDDSVDLSNPYR